MTTSNSPNEAFGLAASSAAEMRAFDALDKETRQLLNYACENYSAVQIAAADAGMAIARGGFTISRPNARAQLLAAIRERESATPPLNQPKRTEREPKVAHATLRPVASGRMFTRRSNARY